MERLKDETEARESQSSSDEGLTIIHLESFFENKAVAIRVAFQRH